MLAIAEQPDPEQPIVHSTKLMLVDKKGVIRNFYDGASTDTKDENAAILRDIQRLLRE
jgi:cytochrome oxidase Cu insertion factor (SCO1/SenC/PrrC family)